jgi:hypothetical protein
VENVHPWLKKLNCPRQVGLAGATSLVMSADFSRRIYSEVKHLFPDGAVDVQVASPSISSRKPTAIDPAVRLVHIPTGVEVSCSEFTSQTDNYIAAVIRLRIACDKHAA